MSAHINLLVLRTSARSSLQVHFLFIFPPRSLCDHFQFPKINNINIYYTCLASQNSHKGLRLMESRFTTHSGKSVYRFGITLTSEMDTISV